jgi:polyvinyl alcohol dehydrogenase (cytochrome)
MRPLQQFVAGACILLVCTPLFAQDGATLYKQHCAVCHDQVSERIPPRGTLQKMSARRILRAMDAGLMMSVASPLGRTEREALANFLGSSREDVPLPPGAFCVEKVPPVSTVPLASWIGWSPTSANTRFQPTKDAGLLAVQIPNIRLKWAFGFPGDVTAFGAPTVRNGVLFVGSAAGIVHAMSAKTGCLYWTFQADGPVRSAPLIAESGGKLVILFGDLVGWFYALDAESGKAIWKSRIDEHEATRLTGSATFHGGTVFVPAASWEEPRTISPSYPCCTFRGSVTALRTSDGGVLWKTYLVGKPQKTGVTVKGTASFGPSGAGVWSAPTVDEKRGLLYIATGNNYSAPATSTSDAVVALRLGTGEIVWSQPVTPKDVWNNSCRQGGPNCPANPGPDFDFGSSPLLTTAEGRAILIAGQKSGVVYALDPDSKGKILWQTRVGKGGALGGIEWGMASDDKNVYAPVSDLARKSGAAAATTTAGDAEIDPNAGGGGLTALRLIDGVKVWFVPGYPCSPPRQGCSPAQPAAPSSIPGAVFSGSMDGHLRAFSTQDGQLLWDFDTVRDYATVNGVPARGGSLDGAGPAIVDGMLYVNSGYLPRFGGMAGNVLLAFSVDGK